MCAASCHRAILGALARFGGGSCSVMTHFSLFGDNYTIGSKLGEGRYGSVSIARSSNKTVAVKLSSLQDRDLRFVFELGLGT